jgi:hypothetical protein
MTVSHLTPHMGSGTLDHFPISNNWLVRGLASVLDIIVNDLPAEETAGGSVLLTKMQKAAQHLAKPLIDSAKPVHLVAETEPMFQTKSRTPHRVDCCARHERLTCSGPPHLRAQRSSANLQRSHRPS